MSYDQDERLLEIAIEMLRENPEAGDYWEVGNSLAGSLLNLLHGVPRQYAEPIVGEAVEQLRKESED